MVGMGVDGLVEGLLGPDVVSTHDAEQHATRCGHNERANA
jgi:hypothetical protein